MSSETLRFLVEGLRSGRLNEARKLPSLSKDLRKAILDVLHGVRIAGDKGVYPVNRIDPEDLRGLTKHRLVKVDGKNAVLTPKGLHYLHKTTSEMRERMAIEKLRVAAEQAAEKRKKEREFKKRLGAAAERDKARKEKERFRAWKAKTYG